MRADAPGYGQLGAMTDDEMKSARRILRYLALLVWARMRQEPHDTVRQRGLRALMTQYNWAAYTLDLVRDDFKF